MSYKCFSCNTVNRFDELPCGTCGAPSPVSHAFIGTFGTSVSGGHAALVEEITHREYGPDGRMRKEWIERRSWTAPATPTPAPSLRAYSSLSFEKKPPALESGTMTILTEEEEEALLRRLSR